MEIQGFWDMFQALGGARQGQRISLGLTSFEDVVAKKIKIKRPNADVHQRVEILDASRPCGIHVVDIISIDVIENRRVITQYEIKSSTGIPHTVAGAHSIDADNMIRYAETLRQQYHCDEAATKVIRRGGFPIPEHSAVGIITEKLEDYLTSEEILQIDATEDKLIARVFKHSGEKGFNIYDDDVIKTSVDAFMQWCVRVRDCNDARNAFAVGQRKLRGSNRKRRKNAGKMTT